MEIKLRPMTISDYDNVIAVWEAAGLHIDPVDDSKFSIAWLLAHNTTSCFVAEVEGKVIGAVLGAYNGRRLWIYHLGVLPNYQKKGVGKKLVLAVTKACSEFGCPKISLAIMRDNLKVAGFYQKFGFYPVTDSVWFSKKID